MSFDYNIIAISIDLLSVLFIILMIRRGTVVGFARSFVRSVGYLLSVAIASIVSKIGSVFIYHTLLEPRLIEMLENSLTVNGNSGSMLSDLEAAVNSLPRVAYLLFDLAGAAETELSLIADKSVNAIAGTVVEQVVSPVVYPLIRALLFIIVLIVGLFIVNALAHSSKVVRDIPLIGTLDGVLGGAFGIVEGVLILAVAAVFLHIALGFFEGRWEWFNSDIISRGFLFKHLYYFVNGDNFLFL